MPIFVLMVFCFIMTCPVSVEGIESELGNDMALEVFQMVQSLDELIQELKERNIDDGRAIELQKLEIAVSYLSFRSRRIEMKEKELQEKKRSRNRIEELVAKINADPEQWERFDTERQPSSQIQPINQESPVAYRLRQLEARIETLDNEIVAMELEINELNSELSEFEEYVEEQLKLLN